MLKQMNYDVVRLPEDGIPPDLHCVMTAFDIRQIRSDEELGKCAACLSDERRKRMDRYLFSDDRKRCAAGQLLAEYTLRCLEGEAIGRIVFGKMGKGKPYIKGSRKRHFNISHSGDWVCCVAADVPVGIDVERIGNYDRNLYEICLTPKEQDALTVCAGVTKLDDLSPEEVEHFIRIWTMKESYLKMTGEGLTRAMNTFYLKPAGNYWMAEAGQTGRADGDDILPSMILSRKWEKKYCLSVCFHKEPVLNEMELD